MEYKCSICGLEPFWNGQTLSLTLDHIDGNHDNQNIDNLRWVCPNCDRQLDTFGAKNIKKKNGLINKCVVCGKEIFKNKKYCDDCGKIRKRELNLQYLNDSANKHIKWPENDILQELVNHYSLLSLSKYLGVSDNAIRKHCKVRGIIIPKGKKKTYMCN